MAIVGKSPFLKEIYIHLHASLVFQPVIRSFFRGVDLFLRLGEKRRCQVETCSGLNDTDCASEESLDVKVSKVGSPESWALLGNT